MTKKYKVSGMHCTSCAMNIEWELEDRGMKAKCDYAKQILEVEFDSKKEPEIKKAIAGLGYTLEEFAVN